MWQGDEEHDHDGRCDSDDDGAMGPGHLLPSPTRLDASLLLRLDKGLEPRREPLAYLRSRPRDHVSERGKVQRGIGHDTGSPVTLCSPLSARLVMS